MPNEAKVPLSALHSESDVEQKLIYPRGQHSLPVFCLGIALSMAGHLAVARYGDGWAVQVATNLSGIVLMLFVGWALDRLSTRRVPAPRGKQDRGHRKSADQLSTVGHDARLGGSRNSGAPSWREVVPPDHLVRKIDAVLDLGWVHKEVAPYYSHTGRPSIDPVLMIRMLIVGYPQLLALDAIFASDRIH